MSGEPIDPISFERATSELWEMLAAHAGLNLMEHLAGADDEQSSELQLERRKTDNRLGLLREEARDLLLGLIIVEGLRAWTVDGQNWKRPTQHTLRARIMNAPDEPWGLFVDREEVEAVITARKPELLAPRRPAKAQEAREEDSIRKRGRPSGSGTYSKTDAPLVDQMRTLVDSGEATSAHAASLMVVAESLGGGTEHSRARRLRNAYLRKWKNGE